MGAERINKPRATIEQLPGAGYMSELVTLIDARIERHVEKTFEPLTPLGLRLRTGLSMRDVEARAHGQVTKVTISKIERGETRTPSDEVMRIIAEALGVTPQEYRAAVARLVSAKELRGAHDGD